MFTDHANLRYYRDARKIGQCVTGYLPEREQYNLLLEYKPGTTNRADTLSQHEDYDTGNPDNEDVTVWPDKYFCEEHTVINTLDTDYLESQVKLGQYQNQEVLKRWASAHNLSRTDGTH